jgi:hypothetical protein
MSESIRRLQRSQQSQQSQRSIVEADGHVRGDPDIPVIDLKSDFLASGTPTELPFARP